jgi:glycosyltransferase involved in cell wall biosynthesis
VVVSSAVHHDWNGERSSYTPYAREIDEWAELFDEVRIVCPVRHEPPGGDASPFAATNVALVAVPETGGSTAAAKVRQAVLVPRMVRTLVREMRQADVVHPRCPGNVGLLALLAQPVVRRPTVTKYAGQWSSYSGESWSYRFQRWLLRQHRWRDPVTVYGRAASDPPHVVSFFSSAISDAQLARGSYVARTRRWTPAIRVLFVGRLSAMKNVDAAVRAVATVAQEGHDVTLTVLGEGPERDALHRIVDALDVADRVDLRGGVPFPDVLAAYADHDVLVLVSETEGFPKVIAEAMAYGLVVIGSDLGFVREMLADGRGWLVPPGDADRVAAALRRVVADPDAAAAMGGRAAAWAGRFSVEALQDGLRELVDQAVGRRHRSAA